MLPFEEAAENQHKTDAKLGRKIVDKVYLTAFCWLIQLISTHVKHIAIVKLCSKHDNLQILRK